MPPLCARNVFRFLLVTVSLFVQAQTPAKLAGQAKTTNDSKSGQTSQKPTPSPLVTLQGQVTSDLSALNGHGDYVKCEFTREQLLDLRPEPEIYYLTKADEDQIRRKVIAEVFDPSNVA